jgi:hypothetical protein
MRGISLSRLSLLVVLGVSVVAFLGGCSDENPVASSGDPGTPQFATVVDPGATPAGRGMMPGSFPKIGQVWVDPDQGATLTVGRFTVTIPPGAVDEPILLTIQDACSPMGVFVQLGPHGQHFNVPVTLSMDLSGTTAEQWSDVTIYWYDEDADEWVDMGGTWDPASDVVTASLDHFSLYGGGRAGW